MRESKVEGYLVQRVGETGGITRKIQWIGRRGAPDRWVGWERLQSVSMVETKKPATPHAAAHQEREHKRLRACGQEVWLIATIEQVDDFIYRKTGCLPGETK